MTAKNKAKTKTTATSKKKIKTRLRDTTALITRQDLEADAPTASEEEFRLWMQQWAAVEINQVKGLNERLDYQKLYNLSKMLYNIIILMNHRCATIQLLCSMMQFLGFPQDVVYAFFKKNIDQKTDCRHMNCDACFTETTDTPPLVFVQVHEGTSTVH